MSSILKSEHSKSVYEFGVTNETHKSNKIKADRYDRILQLPQNENVEAGARLSLRTAWS